MDCVKFTCRNTTLFVQIIYLFYFNNFGLFPVTTINRVCTGCTPSNISYFEHAYILDNACLEACLISYAPILHVMFACLVSRLFVIM